jgi:antitoxin YefM
LAGALANPLLKAAFARQRFARRALKEVKGVLSFGPRVRTFNSFGGFFREFAGDCVGLGRCSDFCTLTPMARIVPFTEARAKLTELLDDVEARHEHLVITRKGRPAAVVVSPEEWDAIEETLDVLQNDQTLADLRESEEDVKAGRLFSLDEVRRELGLA